MEAQKPKKKKFIRIMLYLWLASICAFLVYLLGAFIFAVATDNLEPYMDVFFQLFAIPIIISFFFILMIILYKTRPKEGLKRRKLTPEEKIKRDKKELLMLRIAGTIILLPILFGFLGIGYAIMQARGEPVDFAAGLLGIFIVYIIFVALCWIFDLSKITF